MLEHKCVKFMFLSRYVEYIVQLDLDWSWKMIVSDNGARMNWKLESGPQLQKYN